VTPEHAQFTQEILIQSATWWMDDDEKIAFLIGVILSMAKRTVEKGTSKEELNYAIRY